MRGSVVGHLERHVSAHVHTPESEMREIHVVASRKGFDRRSQFARFVITKRRHARACAVPREIEQKYVELCPAGRHQREHVRALRLISVAHDHRRSAAQSREEPAVARPPVRQRETKTSSGGPS